MKLMVLTRFPLKSKNLRNNKNFQNNEILNAVLQTRAGGGQEIDLIFHGLSFILSFSS